MLRSGRAALLAVLGCAALSGCTAEEKQVPGSELVLYEPDGGSFDILATSELVRLDGGCLGLRRPDGTTFLAAFPRGTSMQGDEVRIDGMDTVRVGEEITYTGSYRTIADARNAGIEVPEACVTPEVQQVWLVLPADQG